MMEENKIIEVELSEFELDKMHHSAKRNLINIAKLLGSLDSIRWADYVNDRVLNLTVIAQKANVSRSSIYQNDHIKTYISKKAEELLNANIIVELPYEKKIPTPSRRKETSSQTQNNNDLKEKNNEIIRLQAQVQDLTAQLDKLKGQLNEKSAKLCQQEQKEMHLYRTGRTPR
jgi:hypothetical protein